MSKQFVEAPLRTFQANSALAEGLRVRLSGGKLVVAGVGDIDSVGVLDKAALVADQEIAVRIPTAEGTVVMVAHAAFSQYAPLYAAAAGRVDDSGLIQVGIAMQAATAQGDFTEVLPIPFVPGGAVGNEIWVSPDGDDNANGTILAPLATITAAFALVTSSRKVVRLFPGTYTEAGALTWPAVNGTHLIGDEATFSTVIGVAAGDEVITFTSGALSSTFEMWISNIHFDHETSGLDGIVIDNTGAGKKINLYLRRVAFEADSDTDRSILVTHGDTSNAVRIYADGRNGSVEGRIEYTAHDAGDRLYFTNMNLDGGVVMGATAVAADLQLRYCRVKHEGVTGGNGAHVLLSVHSWTDDSGTQAALDTSDFAGSGSETII